MFTSLFLYSELNKHYGTRQIRKNKEYCTIINEEGLFLSFFLPLSTVQYREEERSQGGTVA